MHSKEFADESESSPRALLMWRVLGPKYAAKWYDRSVRKCGLYNTAAQLVAENVAEGDSILEVAPGPGYLAIELAKRGRYRIVGLDISNEFVEIAQKNAAEAGVGAAVEFRQGDAAHMPFDDETFDFIICAASFTHFVDPLGVLREMYRVLRTDGKAVVIDLRSDASDETIRNFVKSMGLNRISFIWQNSVYKAFRQRAYTKNEFKELISKTKFQRHDIRESEYSAWFDIWLEK